MTTPRPSRSRKFARYAVASSAALGAAAAAKAQFTGSYTLTPPAQNNFSNGAAAGTFGAWNSTKSGTSATGTGWFLQTTDNGSGLTLLVATSASFAENPSLTFYAFAEAAGNVVFSVNTTVVGSGTHEFYYTADSSTYNLVTGTTASLSGISFAVASGATFGFRVVAFSNYSASSMQAVIFGFSAPTAIPEPASAGLLAGCVTAGYVGLMGARAMRRRAAAKAA